MSCLAVLVVLAQSTRQPVQVGSATEIGLGGGVPSGFSILGESAVPPPGYEFTGSTVVVSTGCAPTVTLPDAPVARQEGVAVPLGDFIYLIGGRIRTALPPGTPVVQIDRFDTSTNTWSTMTSTLPEPRVGHAATVIGGKILIFGGMVGFDDIVGGELQEYSPSVLDYDPTTDSWSSRSPMPVARSGHAVVNHGGRVFLLGGQDSVNVRASMHEYLPSTDTWVQRATMSLAREDLATLILDGKLLVFGRGGIEEYDFESNSWTLRAPGYWAGGLGSVDPYGRVWLATGSSLLELDLTGLVPTNRANVQVPRTRSALARVGSRIYDFGGEGTLDPFGGTSSRADAFDLSATKLMFLHRKR